MQETNKNRQEYYDESDDDILFSFDAYSGDSGGFCGADSGDDGGDDLDLFDPDVFGFSSTDMVMGLVADEDDHYLTQDIAEKLNHAAQDHLSNAGKGREGKKSLSKITEEDFEPGPERDAFKIILRHRDGLFHHKAKLKERMDAIDFFFTLHDDDGITFPLCCEVLGARADVTRLRINYEFWLRWMTFANEFPFMTVPIPEIIKGEILYVGDLPGLELAQEAWMRPGIPQNELLLIASGQIDLDRVPNEYIRALNLLDEKFLMSSEGSRWYLTGRNPYRRFQAEREKRGALTISGGSYYWSREF